MPDTHTPFAEETLPAPLDIVWCRFPFEESPRTPGKPRPALVFSTQEMDEGDYSVQIAYGTSRLKTESRPLDFVVSNLAAMHACGLPQATRFDLDRLRFLPWSAEFFFSRDPSRYPTPKIGSLPVDHVPDLKRLFQQRRKQRKSVPRI